MTAQEVIDATVSRIERFDTDAILASEAFAFGLFDEYTEHRRSELRRRMEERFGSASAEPAGGDSGEAG